MTSPSYYTPRNPSIIDNIGYTQRVVDALLRSNPLHNATIDRGLVRWLGNYNDTDGELKDIVWIGDILPLDPNLPGSPQQRAFIVRRDGGTTGDASNAIGVYDHNPSGPGGLSPTIHMWSNDGQQLYMEHREGGLQFPGVALPMHAQDSSQANWPGTTNGSYDTIYQCRQDVVGNQVHYSVWCVGSSGASGEARLRIEDRSGAGDPDIVGTTHVIPASGNLVFSSWVDVSAFRGRQMGVYWEMRRTNAVGRAVAAIREFRNLTADV